jgi:hypothetical protein
VDETESRGARSRRGFLAGAAGAAIGASVLASAGTASAAPADHAEVLAALEASRHPAPHKSQTAHPHYNRRRFEDAPGGKVVVRLADGPVDLTIESIEPLGVAAQARAGSALWRDAFRVSLTGPKGTDIPQGTHRVSIGGKSFDLFVVPVLTTGGPRRYESIINRAYHRRING